MQNQRGFVGVGVLIAIVLGVIVVGGGAYFVMHQQAPSQPSTNNFDNTQTLPTTNNQTQKQTSPGPATANAQAGSGSKTVGTKSSVTFSVSPSAGPAPLRVTFSAQGLSSANRYTIKYGDPNSGSSWMDKKCIEETKWCGDPNDLIHTYKSPGNYTPILVEYLCSGNWYWPSDGGEQCSGKIEENSVASTLVTAGAPLQADMNVSLLSGPAPLTVSFQISGGEYARHILYFGDGQSSDILPNGTNIKIGHIYQSQGIYAASLVKVTGADEQEVGRATVTVGNAVTPQISLTAPTSATIWLSGKNNVVAWTSNVSNDGLGVRLVRTSDGFRCTIRSAAVTFAGRLDDVNFTIGQNCFESEKKLSAGQFNLVLVYPYTPGIENQGQEFGASNGQPVVITVSN